jgi:hypothetical protein
MTRPVPGDAAMSRYDDYFHEEYEQANEHDPRPDRPHSGLGIVSFVLSLVAGVGELGMVVLAGVLSAHADKEEFQALLGVAILAFGLLAFVGFVLAIVGLTDRRRNRVFAGVGLAFNGMVLLGILGLFVIGLVVSAG